MRRSYSRRAALGIVAVGLAGCSGTTDDGSGGSDATDGDGGDSGDSGGNGPTTAGTTPGTPTPVTPTYDTSVTHDLSSWAGHDPEWSAPTDAPGEVAYETLVTNLEIPWDIAFAPNGEVFLTERTGRVLRYTGEEVVDVTKPADAIDAGSLEPGEEGKPWWVKGGEGGTMGVAVHPNYPDVSLLYVYYTARVDGGKVNRLAYFDVSADDPARHRKVLFEVPAAKIHNGGRITFGPANYLWVTTGEIGEAELAQDRTSRAGKVLRVTPEGKPAPNNPDLGDDADGRIYTYGHRNPQGIAWLPDGRQVINEHGPGPDEVNLLEAGGNYGWPKARKPEEYEGTEFVRPLATTVIEETWAPSGSLFYTGDAVESWGNRYLMGCLASQEVSVVTLTPPDDEVPPLGETGVRHDMDWLHDGFTATTHDRLTNEIGRVRHLEEGPDGALYAITSNRDGRANEGFPTETDDRLVRLVPK
jgi:glucose/arabinose dehydrogenase